MSPRRTVTGMLVLGFLASAPTPAQIPEKFENLQVLPKDIGQRELVNFMKKYTQALGVRCTHCHVGEEGKPLSTFDFKSDDKGPKNITRTMMKMVREINDKHITPLKTDRDSKVEVACRTCHHGLTLPRRLQDVLAEAHENGGREALLGKYRELRERYQGRGAFDFGEWALDDLATQIVGQEKYDDAFALVELHAEHHPRSSHLQVVMGEIRVRSGDKERAIEHYKKALEFDPSDRFAKSRLEAVGG